MAENEKTNTEHQSKPTADLSYLSHVVTKEELIEELNIYTKELRNADLTASFPCDGLHPGITMAIDSTMKVFEDLINRCEEKGMSPDPEHDEFITAMYNVYNALEKIKGRCKFIM